MVSATGFWGEQGVTDWMRYGRDTCRGGIPANRLAPFCGPAGTDAA